MANENALKTRILLRYDSYENWQKSSVELLAGEIAIAYLGPTKTETTPDNGTHPVLVKVGPGVFANLPWMSALAADVFAWAKKETPDWSDFPALPITVVDTETGKFLTDIEYANNTITIHRSDVDWDDVKNKPVFDELYKRLQEEKNFTSTTVKTVTAITQDKQGVINVTYEDIAFPTPPSITIVDDAEAEVPTTETVNVYKNLTENGHTLTEELVEVATAAGVAKALADAKEYAVTLPHVDTKTEVKVSGDYLDIEGPDALVENTLNTYTVSINEDNLKTLIGQQTTAAMEFKGAAATLPANPAKGDMYKVAGENIDITIDGVAAKVGDSIVYDGEKWFLIPSGDDIEDTWRPIKVGDNTLESNESLELIAGANIQLAEEGGKVTISATDTLYDADEESLTLGDNNVFSINEAGVKLTHLDGEVSAKWTADAQSLIDKLVTEGQVHENTEAIKAITDEESGILATAKQYTNDSLANFVKENAGAASKTVTKVFVNDDGKLEVVYDDIVITKPVFKTTFESFDYIVCGDASGN